MTAEKGAVVLLSGGLDSTTTLAVARHEGYSLNAMTFAYGQRHAGPAEQPRYEAKQGKQVEAGDDGKDAKVDAAGACWVENPQPPQPAINDTGTPEHTPPRP